ncbi:Dynactin subunit 6 [Chelonia mydas]|uniref:Dynactin subunit 6 n=1 Tax=Chelonia mydas TaxID=8469 RepID=M7B758_CHEMY|nr:Dynactin subunit 6 [Chelonia mydas]
MNGLMAGPARGDWVDVRTNTGQTGQRQDQHGSTGPTAGLAPGKQANGRTSVRGRVSLQPRYPSNQIAALTDRVEDAIILVKIAPGAVVCVESEIRGDVTIGSQAMKMGDNNVIESKAVVGRNVILTSGCVIGACCNINTHEVIPENTVIYDAKCLRRVQTERPQPQTLQLDFLMKILPNYHHLKKTMKMTSTPAKS